MPSYWTDGMLTSLSFHNEPTFMQTIIIINANHKESVFSRTLLCAPRVNSRENKIYEEEVPGTVPVITHRHCKLNSSVRVWMDFLCFANLNPLHSRHPDRSKPSLNRSPFLYEELFKYTYVRLYSPSRRNKRSYFLPTVLP